MQGVNWGILDQGMERTQRQLERGMDMAGQMIRRRSLGNALADIQADPTNQRATAYLYREAPELALKMQDRARETESRNALAGYLIGGTASSDGRSTPLPGGSMNALMPQQPERNWHTSAPNPVAPTGPGRGEHPPASVRSVDPTFERLARADPKMAMEAQGKRLSLTKDQFELFHNLNEASLQLLGGVHDQATYEAAIRRAEALYGRFGLDLSALNLPAQYDPQVVDGLMRQAMRTKDQFAVMTAENRLDWDIEDDRIDNERADEALENLSSYREGQLANTRRGQDLTDARGRRGQDMTDARVRRGQDMSDQRGRRGQDIRDATTRRGQDLRSRLRGRRVAGQAISDNEPMATAADGTPLVVRNGKWVPVKGGK